MGRPSMTSKSGCALAISMYSCTGHSRSATSSSGSLAMRSSSSCGSSQPRSHPSALVKTPFKRSPGRGSHVKRTGKSKTAGKKPGMPAVFRSSNVSQDSIASRPCAFLDSFFLGDDLVVGDDPEEAALHLPRKAQSTQSLSVIGWTAEGMHERRQCKNAV